MVSFSAGKRVRYAHTKPQQAPSFEFRSRLRLELELESELFLRSAPCHTAACSLLSCGLPASQTQHNTTARVSNLKPLLALAVSF